MIHWLNQINQLFETKTPFVLATIWSINGSSPDSAGDRLVVSNNTCYGQLQSAQRQAMIISQCRIMLSGTGERWLQKDYRLGDVASQKNGHCTVAFEKFVTTGTVPQWLRILRKSLRDGEPKVLANQIDWQYHEVCSSYQLIHDKDTIDSFKQAKKQTRLITNSNKSRTLLQLIKEPHQSIAVVGHSQVTESLVQQLLLLPFQIQWLTKSGHTDTTLQGPLLQHIRLNDQAIEALSAGTKIAIATNDHELDIHYCHVALLNPQLSYVGCLGSQKKACIVRSRLTELGINASRLSALTMPIGLESITGKQPSVIAASIVAQLLSKA